jgi:5-methylcytosine-specific restriction endonuclease McrA
MPICEHCSDFFSRPPHKNRPAKFCSESCYHQSRWGKDGTCLVCGVPVVGARFCGKEHRVTYWNARDKERWPTRRIRYWEKKRKIIESLGGCCTDCGISDIRVLEIDHINPANKSKPAHGNYPHHVRFKLWEKEMDNLQLLCANCHRIKTHRQTWKTDAFL